MTDPAAKADPPGEHPTDTDHPPTDRQARDRVIRRQIVAWLALGVFLLGVIWAGPVAGQLGGPRARSDGADTIDADIELIGRIHLALEHVVPEAGVRATPGAVTRLVSDLEALTIGENERDDLEGARVRSPRLAVRLFRMGVVASEFEGAEAGAERMDQIRTLVADPDDRDALAMARIDEDAALMERVYIAGAETLDPDDRARLDDRHGWIGRLGASYGLPATDPLRDAVATEAVLTMSALIVLALGFVTAFGAGLCLFVLAAAQAARGRLRARFVADVNQGGRRHTAYLESVALFFGGLALLKISAAMMPADGGPGLLAVFFASQWLLLITVIWPLVRGVTWSELRIGVGWTRGAGVFREIGAGLIGYLAGMPIIAIGFVLTTLAVWATGIEPGNPLAGRADSGWLGVVLLYTLAVGWAPIVEEALFRGAFHHHLRRWMSPIPTAIIVAFVFAVAHPQGLAAVPVLMSISIVFSAIREWRGSLIGCMAAHAAHNTMIVSLNVLVMM